MDKTWAILAAGAVVALLGGTALWIGLNRGPADPFAQCRSGQAGADIGGPFTLVEGTSGKTVTEKEVIDRPTLVYFGYTFCPDVCPLDMARNADAVDKLQAQGIEVTPVFITIDPERDTPAALADYAANLHPKLVALTGSPDQVKAASQAYKTFYKKRETGDEYYLMDHSTFTYLMLPGTGFVDFFRQEITSDQMAESVACFVKAGKA